MTALHTEHIRIRNTDQHKPLGITLEIWGSFHELKPGQLLDIELQFDRQDFETPPEFYMEWEEGHITIHLASNPEYFSSLVAHQVRIDGEVAENWSGTMPPLPSGVSPVSFIHEVILGKKPDPKN